MKVYLSGPMTGLPELNYPTFRGVAKALRAEGYEVYNPADWGTFGVPTGPGVTTGSRPFDLRRAFLDYTEFIINHAEAVVVLPGWETSPGATAEAALARALGKPVYAYEPHNGSLTQVLAAPPCPDHKERQRRDGNPPWCRECGWSRGQAARKAGSSRAEREAFRTSEVP